MHAFDRHQRPPLPGHGVRQRDGEPELVALRGKPADLRDDAGGRDGDALGVDGTARRMAEDARGLDDVLVVEERLAHPHEDDAADRPIGFGPDGQHLSDDLGSRQVAPEAERAGRAERARQRAPSLRRDADDVLLFLTLIRTDVGAGSLARHRNPHRLDSDLKQVLHEPIGRDLPFLNAQRLEPCPGVELTPDAAHLRLAAHGRGQDLAAGLERQAARCPVFGQHTGAML